MQGVCSTLRGGHFRLLSGHSQFWYWLFHIVGWRFYIAEWQFDAAKWEFHVAE